MIDDLKDIEYRLVIHKTEYIAVLEMCKRISKNYSYANAVFKSMKLYNNKNIKIDLFTEYDDSTLFLNLYDCFIRSRFCNHIHIRPNRYENYDLDFETEIKIFDNDCEILYHYLNILPETVNDLERQFRKYVERKNRRYIFNNETITLRKLNELYKDCVKTFPERDYVDDEDCDEREILHISEYEQNKIDFLRYCIEYFKKDKSRPFTLVIHKNNNSLLLRELSKTILKTIGIDVITL